MKQSLSVITEVMVLDNIGQSHDGGVKGNVLVNHKHTVGVRSAMRKSVAASASGHITRIRKLVLFVLKSLIFYMKSPVTLWLPQKLGVRTVSCPLTVQTVL